MLLRRALTLESMVKGVGPAKGINLHVRDKGREYAVSLSIKFSRAKNEA